MKALGWSTVFYDEADRTLHIEGFVLPKVVHDAVKRSEGKSGGFQFGEGQSRYHSTSNTSTLDNEPCCLEHDAAFGEHVAFSSVLDILCSNIRKF